MPAYYRSRLSHLLAEDEDRIFAALNRGAAQHNVGLQYPEQAQVWDAQLPILRRAIQEVVEEVPGARRWSVLLEFPIPRMRRRIDCVILGAGIAFVVEFKSHGDVATAADRRQVQEYCIDLNDFHEGSRGLDLLPIVVTGASDNGGILESPGCLSGPEPVSVPSDRLADALVEADNLRGCGPSAIIDGADWDNAAYTPVPTIIEAAEMMFAGHGVRDIGHAHAAPENLTTTSEHLVQTVMRARADGRHVMCFVTGVPGAGKTLTGLNVVHDPRLGGLGADEGEGATYLSGNGPLVRVLREALARDQSEREQLAITEARHNASRAIQNVHEFIWDCYERDEAPWEHAIVFDEAQRAWDADQVNRKRHVPRSEPRLISEILGRHPDWAVVIALVGGGQEIHDGEAGLQEWGRALAAADRRWDVKVSPEMVSGHVDAAGSTLFPDAMPPSLGMQTVEALHLPVPLRTFRADAVASWVDHLLSGEANRAALDMSRLGDYPIVMTRCLAEAREWLRQRTAGQRRCGLVASSGARRLRAWGVDMQARPEVVHWFLGPPEDVRSSYYLELAASEFEIQGLELDHIGLCWGGDLTRNPDRRTWRHRRFWGTEWQSVRNRRHQEYLVNKYRVLLTRARESLVIWIPPDRPRDPTIDDEFLDETWAYLQECGVPEL